VLVTLRPVADHGAAAFMQRFYHHGLGQPGRSDPAAALRAAQVEAIAATAQGTGMNQTWAQFVMVGGGRIDAKSVPGGGAAGLGPSSARG
jgi:CHAT domain-containing protein